MTDKDNLVAYAKKLKIKGYTNKQIEIITGLSQSDVSKIVNNKLYVMVREQDYTFDNDTEVRRKVLDRILELRDIPGVGGLSNNDKYYIKLIKICGGTYDAVRSIYYDRPGREIRPAWNYANQFSYNEFDPALLGLTTEEFEVFIRGVRKWI